MGLLKFFLAFGAALATVQLVGSATGGDPMSVDRFQQCPHSPNCVSSLAPEGRHFIEPLRFRGSSEEALECVAQVLRLEKRARIVVREFGYLRAEFRTWMGFVDDVEFLVDSEAGLIHMRSASRTGYWDVGVNRRRLERLRGHFLGRCQPA